jgi:hypothetical protein
MRLLPDDGLRQEGESQEGRWQDGFAGQLGVELAAAGKLPQDGESQVGYAVVVAT